MIVCEPGTKFCNIVQREVNVGTRKWPKKELRWVVNVIRAGTKTRQLFYDGRLLVSKSYTECRRKAELYNTAIIERKIGRYERYFTPSEAQEAMIEKLSEL